MTDQTVTRRVCSSILEKDGKFAVLIHWGNGVPIYQSDFKFNTVDEAKAAGTETLNQGIELAKERGLNVYRPLA
jgi:hypothetical protein